MAVDPEDADIAYAAVDGVGILRTTDGGGTWSPFASGLLSGPRALAASASSTIYAATGDGVYEARGGGRWARILEQRYLWSIAVNPDNPNQLLAGGQNGVFWSSDSGSSWSKSTGLGSGGLLGNISISPADPMRVYGSDLDDVFRSADGGRSWVRVGSLGRSESPATPSGGAPRTAEDLEADAGDPETVYAPTLDGLFVSRDGGASWRPVGKPAGDVSGLSIAVRRSSPSTIVFGSYSGIYQSRDEGRTWSATNDGLSALGITSLALGPRRSSAMWVSSETDLYRSSGSSAWKAWQPAGSVAVHPRLASVAFISLDKGFYRTTASGVRWQRLSRPGFLDPVAVAPSRPNTIYAGDEHGAVRSDDGGRTWLRVSRGLANPSTNGFAIHPRRPDVVYLGTTSGVFKTTDGGQHWRAAGRASLSAFVISIVLDQTHPETVFVGTDDADVFRSVDGGAHWQRLGRYGAHVSLSADGRQIYAGDSLRVTTSEDGGRSWRDLSMAPNRLTGLGVDGTGRYLVAATEGAGVWRLALK